VLELDGRLGTAIELGLQGLAMAGFVEALTRQLQGEHFQIVSNDGFNFFSRPIHERS
jgi:hypothetical protein